MLEAFLATNVVDQCLASPDNAPTITQSNTKFLFKLDFELLLSSAMSHPSVTPAALIAKNISWKKIWDNALDYGIKGTKCTQTVLSIFYQIRLPYLRAVYRSIENALMKYSFFLEIDLVELKLCLSRTHATHGRPVTSL